MNDKRLKYRDRNRNFKLCLYGPHSLDSTSLLCRDCRIKHALMCRRYRLKKAKVRWATMESNNKS